MQYSQKVLDHFMKPHNVGKLEDPDGTATEGSPACGDQVSIFLKVDEDTHIISDIKFQSYGCASNIATASIITDLAKGKTLEEAKEISWKEAAEALDGCRTGGGARAHPTGEALRRQRRHGCSGWLLVSAAGDDGQTRG